MRSVRWQAKLEARAVAVAAAKRGEEGSEVAAPETAWMLARRSVLAVWERVQTGRRKAEQTKTTLESEAAKVEGKVAKAEAARAAVPKAEEAKEEMKEGLEACTVAIADRICQADGTVEATEATDQVSTVRVAAVALAQEMATH